MGGLPVMSPAAVGWQVELRRESFYLMRTDDRLVADVAGFGFPEDGTEPLRAALELVAASESCRAHPHRDASPLPWAVVLDGGWAYLHGPIITFGLGPSRSMWADWTRAGSVEVRYRDVAGLQKALDKLNLA